ncbi:hypothetical protein EUX98_g2537 [Antrodiella citrinella]|uniref:Uncharacterized protein n=1 Tax=Antrodiella citrinella TaxID=2447956 RepID=A0A4S4N704_9APHY|nr:hypothetical protein EUX98_g2537 [Antrodiella citrinella]
MESEYDGFAREETRILRLIVEGFNDGAWESVMDEALTEAQRWLYEDDDQHPPGTLRSEAVATVYRALSRYKSVMRQTLRNEEVEKSLNRRIDALYQELEKNALVESNLLNAQGELAAQLKRSQKALFKSEEEVKNHRRDLAHIMAENRQLKKRQSNPSNPLPPPPVPVKMSLEWLAPPPSPIPPSGRTPSPPPRHGPLQAGANISIIKPGAALKYPSMVPGAPRSERVVIGEDNFPRRVEQPQPAFDRIYHHFDANQTPTHRNAVMYGDAGGREAMPASSRDVYVPEREPERQLPPRSQPRPFPNAAAIERLPPAPGLGLLDSAPSNASGRRLSHTPAPIPGPSGHSSSSPPADTDQLGLYSPTSTSSRRRDPRNGTTAPPALVPYSQGPAMLSELSLGLAEMPAPIDVPDSQGVSATSSLGDLNIFGLRNMPAPAFLPVTNVAPSLQNSSAVNVTSSRNSASPNVASTRNTPNASSSRLANASNVSLARSQSSAEGPRPIVSALAGSRNASSVSVTAPRIQRRRVSFDPEAQTIQSVDVNDVNGRGGTVVPEARESQSLSREGSYIMDIDEPFPETSLGLATSGQTIHGLEELNHVSRSLSSLADNTEERRQSRTHVLDRSPRGSRDSTAYVVERAPDRSPIVGSSSGHSGGGGRPMSTAGTLGGIYRDTRSSSYVSLSAAPRPIPLASPRPIDVRPAAVAHIYDHDADSSPVSSGSSGSSRRHSTRRDSLPTAAAERSYESLGGGIEGLSSSSLLLNFHPIGPGNSEATTSNGDPSSIYAPRPSRHGSNNPAAWLSRNFH